MSQLISVIDILPEIGEDVIAYSPDAFRNFFQSRYLGLWEWEGADDGINVTHWMTLPEKPNDKTKKINKLHESAKTILEYLKKADCGCNYWTDTSGEVHSCNMKYIFSFLQKVLEVDSDEPVDKRKG